MMNVESSSMFSESLSCRSPSQLRNRLDGLGDSPHATNNTAPLLRSRATSCLIVPTKALEPESLSASSSRSGSLADLRRERMARAQSLGDSLHLWPVPLPAGVPTAPEDSPTRRPRANAIANDIQQRPRASSMPIPPTLKIFPIYETEMGQ